MKSIHIKPVLILLQRKIVITIFAIFICGSLVSQDYLQGNVNYNKKKSKPYYFGMAIGFNSSGYQVHRSKNFVQNDSIQVVNGRFKGGFNLHIVSNLKIGQFFDFRLNPGFAFTSRELQYDYVGDNQSKATIESVFFEMPILMRYKSVPYKDKRLFLVGGIKYAYDVASNARAQKGTENVFKVSPHDFQVEFGVGMQFFNPYYIFSPEIKFSQGIGNVQIYDNSNEQSRVLDQVLSRMLTISFIFEG